MNQGRLVKEWIDSGNAVFDTSRLQKVLWLGPGAAAAEADTQTGMMESAPEAETGKRPPNLLDGPQGDADDLTKISGVGPGLNEKLNQNGVYHFWQIADWGPDEVAYMDGQLSFKGRIDRDNWIEQAKELAAEATGGDAETPSE